MDVEYDDQEEEIDLFARDGPGAKQKARKRKAGRGSGRSQQTRSAQRHPRAPPPAAAAAPDPPEAAAAIPGPVSAVTRVDQQAVEQGEAVFAAADTAAEMTGPSWHNERPQYIQEYKESLIRQSGVKSLPGRSEMGQACFAVLRDVATAEGVFTGIKVSACMHPPHAGLVVMYMPGPHGHSHLHGSLVVLPLPTTARQIHLKSAKLPTTGDGGEDDRLADTPVLRSAVSTQPISIGIMKDVSGEEGTAHVDMASQLTAAQARVSGKLRFEWDPWHSGRCDPMDKTCGYDGGGLCPNRDCSGHLLTEKRTQGTLTGMGHTRKVTVFSYSCPACSYTLQYDGHTHCIFNLSNHSLFLYEALFEYTECVAASPMSFSAFHAIMKRMHDNTGCEIAPPSRAVVRHALQHFINLLDINYGAEFSCPCCPKEAKDMVFIADGTTLGHRSDLKLSYDPPMAESPAVPPVLKYYYLADAKSAKPLLHSYLKLSSTKKWPATDASWRDLMAQCETVPGLHATLKLMEEDLGVDVVRKDAGPYRRLLCCVVRDYPISALLKPEFVALQEGGTGDSPFMRLVHGDLTIECVTGLMRGFPALGDLVRRRKKWPRLPAGIVQLCGELDKKARVGPSTPTVFAPLNVDDKEYDADFSFFGNSHGLSWGQCHTVSPPCMTSLDHNMMMTNAMKHCIAIRKA